MSYSVTPIVSPEGEVKLQLEASSDEVYTRYHKVLEDYRRRARIPGFRPGKVPVEVIKQRFGKDLWSEMAENLAKEWFQDAIRREGFTPGGTVRIKIIDFGEDRPLKAEAYFPLKPEVKLRRYKDLPILITDAEITDRDVDHQIEILRRRYAQLEEVEGPSSANARLTLRVKEVDPSGLLLVGKVEREEVVELGTDALGQGSDEQLLGLRRGEKRLIRIRRDSSLLSSPPPSSKLLSQEHPSHLKEDHITVLMVEVLKIEEPKLPEIDEQLAQKINPHLRSVQDLREYIRLSLMGMVAERVQRNLERLIIQKTIEENEVKVPPSLVEETLFYAAKDLGVKEEDWERFRDENFPQAERDYRWVLLRDAIAQEEGLEVSDDEVEQEFHRIAEITGEGIGEVKKRLGGGEAYQRLRGRIFERRVIDFLAKNAQVERRIVDLNTFLRTYGEGE